MTDATTATNELHARTPELMQEYGRARHGGYVCPLCNNGSGEDGTGMEVMKDGYHLKCHRCGFYGDLVDLWAQLDGIEQNSHEAFKNAYSRAGISVDGRTIRRTSPRSAPVRITPTITKTSYAQEIAQYAAAIWAHPQALDYLHGRGFVDETIKRFRLGYTNFYGIESIVIPFSRADTHYCLRAIGSATFKSGKPHFTPKETSKELFNSEALTAAGAVFVVESHTDAMSIEQSGAAAVAIDGNMKSAGVLFAELDKMQTPPMLIICGDNDQDGRENTGKIAQAALAAELERRGIRFMEADLTGKYKDANERLQKDPAGLAAAVREATTRAAGLADKETPAPNGENPSQGRTGAANGALSFLYADKPFYEPIRTGFPSLDKILSGGFIPGLYVLGAMPGAGKTSISMQIADTVAAAGLDVIFYSLEMDAEILRAKSISRMTAQSGCFGAVQVLDLLTRQNARTPQQEQAIAEAARTYTERIEPHLVIRTGRGIGAGSIRADAEKHKQEHGKPPVMFIDYLQMLAAGEKAYTDKQRVDGVVLELAQIARDLRTPIIAISSWSRDAYAQDATLSSGKESGSVEYSASCVLMMQPTEFARAKDESEQSATARRKEAIASGRDFPAVTVKILKSRLGTKGSADFRHDGAYGLFTEQPNR